MRKSRYSNKEQLVKWFSLLQGFLTWGAEINFRECWEGHICGGQK